MRRPPFTHGLTCREARFLGGLKPPWRIQRFLDGLAYDLQGRRCRSPRRVLVERTVQCMDGALFAAAALRLQGHRPLIIDLEGVHDSDHVVAVYRLGRHWGGIARSNFSGLRFREPIFRTIRELVLSYFESYFNLRREKTLRRYSGPVDLSRFDARGWMTSEEDLWFIAEHLVGVRHSRILSPRHEGALGPVDPRMFAAGLVGQVKKKARRPHAHLRAELGHGSL